MPEEHEAPSIADAMEGQPQEAPDASGQATEPDTSTETFSETFDPAALPDEIREQYNNMRADYTRKTQDLAEQRREAEQALALQEALLDPDQQAEVLNALGYELDDDGEYEYDEDVEDYEDPNEARLNALEQYLQEREQGEAELAEQQHELAQMEADLEELEAQTGREFTDEEVELLVNRAIIARGEEGLPDIKSAYEFVYSKVLPNEQKRYTQSKRFAPHVAKSGSSATEEIDLDRPDARVDALLELAEQSET